MNAFMTFVAPCRIRAVLCCSAVLLLTACGGSIDATQGQQSVAAAEVVTAHPADHAAPAAEAAAAPADAPAAASAPLSAAEQFKANSQQAYGAPASPEALQAPAPAAAGGDVQGVPAG